MIAGIKWEFSSENLKQNNQKIRLLGIDAPEINQTCKMSYLKFSI